MSYTATIYQTNPETGYFINLSNILSGPDPRSLVKNICSVYDVSVSDLHVDPGFGLWFYSDYFGGEKRYYKVIIETTDMLLGKALYKFVEDNQNGRSN